MDIKAALESFRTELVELLGDGRAHYEPSKVNSPGVWIDFKRPRVLTLDGQPWYDVELVLAVRSSDAGTVADKLSELYNAVVGLYGLPTGEVRAQSTVFPDGPNGRPSLVLPYTARP